MNKKKVLLAIPEDAYEEIKEFAESSDRSFTNAIIYLAKQTLQGQEPPKAEEPPLPSIPMMGRKG